ASDAAQQQQDDQDHQQQAEAAARVVAPSAAVGPGRQGSDQEQDQDDQEDCSKGHRVASSAVAGWSRKAGRKYWPSEIEDRTQGSAWRGHGNGRSPRTSSASAMV